jgi:hypothetical protein
MKIRKVLAVVMAATVIGVFAMQSSAGSIHYNCNYHKYLGNDTNPASSWRYLHVNNSYSSGKCGVYLSVENSSGSTVYGRKLFPYATTISDLVVSVPGNAKRYFWVEPGQSSHLVSGHYNYLFSTSS